ncbi:MAG: YdiY family protein [Paracoccaceae bacterium]
MKNVTLLTSTAAILAALSVPAFAQTERATGASAVGVTAIDDRITDIEDAVQDDFDRSADRDRFGPADRRTGLFGTMSLSYTGRTGNTENQDLAIAGRVNYNQGQFAQSVGVSIEFGENDNGERDTEETQAIYDAQYYFNDQLYAFALGSLKVDGLVDGDNRPTDLRRDGFLGFGPGYRIINTQDTAWRVQAGVGIRYQQTGAAYANDEGSDTEIGYIASSRLYHRFNDTIFLTNDTDYLASKDAQDRLTNELGVNFRVSDQLATRMSYRTEYVEDRDIRTDNRLGIAVVYGF